MHCTLLPIADGRANVGCAASRPPQHALAQLRTVIGGRGAGRKLLLLLREAAEW